MSFLRPPHLRSPFWNGTGDIGFELEAFHVWNDEFQHEILIEHVGTGFPGVRALPRSSLSFVVPLAGTLGCQGETFRRRFWKVLRHPSHGFGLVLTNRGSGDRCSGYWSLIS